VQTDLKYFPKTVANSSFRIRHDKLDYEVVSCMQAARAKGINIANELKTLILSTSKGYVALHICGDRQANLREIKTFLNCDQASLASPKDLGKMKLGSGKICPYFRTNVGYASSYISTCSQLKTCLHK
jgi:prolyl-tRNA editing enzyme YbaK/EbsC (Cys-tRNA(Pro) deacylase)